MATTASVSPARACAYAVVRRVFEQGAYADRAFHAQARGLDHRERSFAMALAYGTVQRKATLDHVIERLSDRPVSRLDPPVLAALRLGLMQLLLLDGVAEHAAVHESVQLAKLHAPGGSGLVNAVLRRAGREGRAIVDGLHDRTPADAAVKHSVPVWLAELWWRELGAERARSLLAAVNRPAESAVRANTLLTPDVAALAADLGVASHPAPDLPEGLVLEAGFDAHGSPQWERGELMPQSRASMTVARTLAPVPGERVLDLCAAPGAKTTHLAALMADSGELTAVERHEGRARALRATLERMRVTSARVEVADAAEFPAADATRGSAGDASRGPAGDATRGPAADAGYDRVLVDPPCSGLGTLQSRPDLRWRVAPGQIAELAAEQLRILRAGAAATRPGGTLVYSVCTIARAESTGVIDAFLATDTQWERDAEINLAPDADGTDGFFIVRLHRRED
ncbi:MAG TPA: 16S rRNA (cytosine(967)-C(5))-methyltransferase RsmB [Solirubrobacteraceae bacterium]|nr:16S rRNA (cytosine(967)-C(5))-methyltransferase RsmB [Solirubrobacteraceae bacterium]